MSKTFDPTKPVQTRDGRPARIICTDVKHQSPMFRIQALVEDTSGNEHSYPYSEDGRFDFQEHDIDLINVPVKRSMWQTVTGINGWLFSRFPSKERAIAAQTTTMPVIGHLRYDYEDDVIVNVEFEPC